MPIDPSDERLARLAARSRAHRDELARPAGTWPTTPPPTEPPPGAPARRRHAARGSRRAALALSAVSTLGLAGWFHQVASADPAEGAAAPATATTPTTTTATGSSPSGAASSSSSPGTAGSARSSTGSSTASGTEALADGSFTGTAVRTRYGPVQVRITVADGAIDAVDVVASPSSDRKSASISARSVPVLTREALTAQSADVDSVSGATYTSTGYRTSLQSAIDAAAAADASS